MTENRIFMAEMKKLQQEDIHPAGKTGRVKTLPDPFNSMIFNRNE